MAIRLPNSTAFVAAYFGVLRAGAVVVPLNMLLAPPEVEERLAASSRSSFVDEELPSDGEPAGEVVERSDDDPAVILFTSGTSGRPKGAVLTHGGILAAARNAADAMAFAPDDVVLGAAPFSHVLGQSTGLVATFLAGAAVAVVPRFDAEATLATMSATRTTILLGVPTMCIALCEAARGAAELPPVRIAHVGGAAVPDRGRPRLRADVRRRRVRGVRPHGAERHRDDDPHRPAAQARVGRACPSAARRSGSREPDERGVGEVHVPRAVGDLRLLGRRRRDREAIDADGWLATGDVGYLDDDGYLFLVDRKKELIIRGGYNVYPREVEEALYAHPGVLEAAVVGVPARDARRGGRRARRAAAGRVRDARGAARRGRRSGSPRTSTRAGSSSSTGCRRGRPARS